MRVSRKSPVGPEAVTVSKTDISNAAVAIDIFLIFFSGVPQRLDAGDLGRPTRYCYLESIYYTWDGGTDHRASLVSLPTQCVAVLGGLH